MSLKRAHLNIYSVGHAVNIMSHTYTHVVNSEMHNWSERIITLGIFTEFAS